MAEEKILANEIIDDADLEGVAGGTMKEIWDDRVRLEKLGLYKFDKSVTQSVNNAFSKLGSSLGVDLKVTLEAQKNTANKYFLDDVEVSRKEFWAIIDDAMAVNKK